MQYVRPTMPAVPPPVPFTTALRDSAVLGVAFLLLLLVLVGCRRVVLALWRLIRRYAR